MDEPVRDCGGDGEGITGWPQKLPGLQLIEMENSLLLEAAQLAAELGLRGADSTYVAVAARLDLPLVTLDLGQRERAGKRIKVVEIPG